MKNFLGRTLPALVLVLFVHGMAAAQTPAGRVVAIAGDCSVESGGKATALKLGAAVNLEDRVSVSDSAKLKIRLNDGSVVSVGSGTAAAVSDLALDGAGKRDRIQISLGQGLLRAVVTPVTHPASFEVKTATGTAAVRSTDWFIQATPGLTEVAVLSGSVTLMSNSTGIKVTIPALYTASVAEGRDPTEPHPMKAADFNPLISATEIAATPAPRPPVRRPRPREEYNPEPAAPSPSPDQSPPPGAYQGPPPGAYDAPPPGYGGPPPGSGFGIPDGPGIGGFGFGGRGGGGYNGGNRGGGSIESGGRTGGTTSSPTRGR